MQISIFNLGCQKPYKIKKPIRLIELFGGIGSQAKALENLKANFTHYRLCEFDKYAVTSYNAIHKTSFLPSDITKLSAKDLGITETDKYDYILTYSFPCQDLSIAGKQAGMAKGSNTRSGLLWEVERLLKECKELPQVLLMENVPQVLNCDFGGWLEFLESKGYHNYYKCLNAKNYGIPQNRDRCFMVSVLGNYYYDFPKEIPLKLRLKDMLEKEVDEKYYIKAEQVKNIKLNEIKELTGVVLTNKGKNFEKETEIAGTLMARDYKGFGNQAMTGVIEPKCEVVAQLDGSFESTGRIYGADGLCPTINTMGGGQREPKIVEPIIYDDFNQCVKADQTAINTLTTNCGSSAERNGDTAPTLRTNCQGLKVIEPKTNERFFRQAIETANKNECENGDTINAFNKTVDKTGISPTITTRPEGFKTAILPIQNYRIRKLTPKECWRLMGFSDKDFYAAQSAGVSNSQLYKQAGNSIVVNVLEEIFKKLF